MALASNVFDLLGEGEDSSHGRSLLSIIDDEEAKAAFEAAERKRREEAKEAARKRKDAEKKLKEAARKKKEKEEEAERKRKEQEERASMARRLENRRRWFESQEQKKRQLEEEKRWWEEEKRQWEEQQRRLGERKKMEEEDEKLRKENPEKWEEENKRREKESIKAAVLGLLRPRRAFGSPSSPLEFQRRGSPGYKQGQVPGAKTKQVPRSPSTLSDPSDIVSLSSYSGSTSTRPSTSDQTQGSQRSAAVNTSAKPAVMAASLSSMSNESNIRSQRAEAIKIRPAVILASSGSVLPTSAGPRLREGAKINGPAVKVETAGLFKKEESADRGSDIAVVPTSATNRSSSSDQVQGSERKEAKDNGTDGEGWQLVASRRRRKQGSDRRSNPDQTETFSVDNKELKKDKSRGAAVVVESGITDVGHVNMNGNKDSTAVDGDIASMSSDGRSRRNKNGSLRRKLKKKNAEGEKKAAEDTSQEADTRSVQNQSTPRLYTMKEYEEMKKRDSLMEKKYSDNNSSCQQPQPKKVTIDVNKEFQTPQVDKKQRGLDNGGWRYNNDGRRFNNGGLRYNYGERNNGGRKYDNRGQRFNNEGRELQFSFDNVDEFPTLGRRKEMMTTSTKLV